MLVGLENNTHNDTIPFYLSSNYQTLQLMLQYRPVSYEMLHTVSRLHFKQQAHIQGVPGGKDLTSGECSLGQTIPI